MSASLAGGWGFIALLFTGLFPVIAAGMQSGPPTLRGAVARADITPPSGTKMWGYFDRTQGAAAVLDPLYARVLLLDNGTARLALVTVDLGRSFGPESLAWLRDTARRDSGISELVLAASHTHSGPVILDSYADGAPAWETTALHRIADAIHNAAGRLEPVRLGAGEGSVDIGYNRRRLNPDGTVTMIWSNPTEVPTAPVDPTVSVLRVDRSDGTPLAILTNYACHAVIFGSDNLKFSADWPGVMNRYVERQFGPVTMSFFLQGAAGDINPFDATIPLQDGAVQALEATGDKIGSEVVRLARSIRSRPGDGSILWKEETIPVQLRWDAAKYRAALLKSLGPDAFQKFAPSIQEQMNLPVTTLLLDHRFAFMTMPGEPFVDFQVTWRNRSPFVHTFFLGYTDGYYGYIPTIQAASQGGYGAASTTTWVAPDTGDRLVSRALVMLYQITGKLQDLPEDAK
jgi:neutral ceramidase